MRLLNGLLEVLVPPQTSLKSLSVTHVFIGILLYCFALRAEELRNFNWLNFCILAACGFFSFYGFGGFFFPLDPVKAGAKNLKVFELIKILARILQISLLGPLFLSLWGMKSWDWLKMISFVIIGLSLVGIVLAFFQIGKEKSHAE